MSPILKAIGLKNNITDAVKKKDSLINNAMFVFSR